MMKPVFLMGRDGETELYTHIECAVDAGLKPPELKKQRCSICDTQFFCETVPEEACLLIEVGGFDDDDKFVADHRGAIHWACAHRIWAPELFENIEGTTITIEEARNA